MGTHVPASVWSSGHRGHVRTHRSSMVMSRYRPAIPRYAVTPNRRQPEQVPGPERDGRIADIDLVAARTGDRLCLGCTDRAAGGAGPCLVEPESGHSILR